MLERQDLEMIRAIMKEEIAESQEHILTEIDRRLDSRFTESENLILGELDRVQDNLTERLDTMKRR